MPRKRQTKKCSKCKKVKPLLEFYYHRTRRHYMSSCKKCNDKRVIDYYKKIKTDPTPQAIFQRRVCDVYRRCRNKKIPYEYGLGKHLCQLWEESNQECYYTGRKMSLVGYHTTDDAVTIDRLVPEKGYVKGNLVLCCTLANRVKQNLKVDELVSFCKEVIQNFK